MMYLQENIPEAVGPEDEDVLELIESMFGAEIPVSGRSRLPGEERENSAR